LSGWLALGCPARCRADLFLYEGLNYGAVDGDISGKGGNELGFTSAEPWKAGGAGTYKAAGLTFGPLVTSGGSLFLASNVGGGAYRGLNVSPAGDVFGGFLFSLCQFGGSSQGSICFGATTGIWDPGLRFRPFTGTAASIADPSNVVTSSSAAGYTSNTTYLALFKIADVGGGSSHTFKMWVLSASQFANFKSSGLTEAALNAATVGTGSANLFAKVSPPAYSGAVPLNAADYLVHRVSNDGGTTQISFDEYRLGASLDDVTPCYSVPVVAVDRAADGIGATGAVLHATLVSAGGPAADLYRCLGASPAAWTTNLVAGSPFAAGAVSNVVSGLLPNTTYSYTFFASNGSGVGWAPATNSFRTRGAPVITNAGVADLTTSGATLIGVVTETGGVATTVYSFCGTNPATWSASSLGVCATGSVTSPVAGLLPDTDYFYTFLASNAIGAGWAPTTNAFHTPGPPAIASIGAFDATPAGAKLVGTLLSTGGCPTTVFCLWGLADALPSFATTTQVSFAALGWVTNPISGLQSNTDYAYTFLATNALGASWAATNIFRTSGGLAFASGAPTIQHVGFFDATLSARLIDVSAGPARVYACWGTNAAALDQSVDWGLWPAGGLTHTITGLQPQTPYWVALRATNAAGQAWTWTNFFVTATAQPTIETLGVNRASAVDALVAGNLVSTGAWPTTVCCVWGPSNALPELAFTNVLSPDPQINTGIVTTVLAPLTLNTAYAYTFLATNADGASWAAVTNFVLTPAPSIQTGSATSIGKFSATLQGSLISTASAPTWACCYWGTTAGVWIGSASVGPCDTGTVSVAAVGLAHGTTYWFTFQASNATAAVWAPGTNSFATAAETFYVNAANVAPAYPFTNWATAAVAIQDAIDAAADGDTVWVTNGIYAAGGRAVYNGFTNRVALNKGITVQSVNGPGVTTIVGQGPAGSAAVRCAYVGANAVLSGFMLTNGATRNTGDSTYEQNGGAVWAAPAGVISNCVLAGCQASNYGGGGYGGSYWNCTVTANRSLYFGGGVYGGKLYACVVSSNLAVSSGGGLYKGTATLCRVVGNLADSGGGSFGATLLGCALAYNRALITGGGSSGAGTISNCTIVGNMAGQGVGGLNANGVVTNCIVYGNYAPVDANVSSGSTTGNMYRCCAWPAAGINGITNDPQLVSAWHIAASSPCAGTGVAGSGSDLDGEPWRATSLARGCDEPWSAAFTGALSVALSADYSSVRTGLPVYLSLQVNGMASSNRWTFGDGRSGSNQTFISASWPSAGTYTVTATVFNATCTTGVSACVTIRVDSPGTRYVSATNSAPVYPYSSWATAATNIQDAIDAGVDGDTILVGDGLYAAGGRVVAASLMSRVAMTRAMTVRSVNGPASTIIVGRGPIGESAVRCAYLGTNCVLAGFTLTNGATRTMGIAKWEQNAGGVLCDPSALVSNCVIAGCQASGYGGGMVYGTVAWSRISDNVASYGGGLYDVNASNCEISRNRASQGAGVNNNAPDILSDQIYPYALVNCVVADNRASSSGGGMYYGLARNCTFVGNISDSYVGGVGGYSALINCILYFNIASDFANYEPGYYNAHGSQIPRTAMTNCCTTPDSPYGVACSSASPQLATTWRLAAGSPCSGAGLAGAARGTDFEGQEWKSPPSIGADEYWDAGATGTLSLAISADKTVVASGLPITFTATIQGVPMYSYWSFDDGVVVSNAPIVAHAWATPGLHTAILRAYNHDTPDGVGVSMLIQVATTTTRYVNVANPTPAPPYASWATAATTIQDAVDAAVAGDTVIVTNGVYAVGGRVGPYASAALTNRVCVTNQIAIRSVNGAAVTVIQGGGVTNGPGAVRAVYLSAYATLEGFAVTGGRTYVYSGVYYDAIGGGVCCDSLSAPTVRACVLSGNQANYGGGGVAFGSFYASRIVTNICPTGSGGGSYYTKLYNCLVASNVANYGGGCYDGELRNCTVAKNTATNGSYGGSGTYSSDHWNTIVYGNGASAALNVTGARSFVSSWSNNPVFLNLAAGDYHLGASPCIDAGTDLSGSGITSDLDGVSRPLDGNGDGTPAFDIGCYEFNPVGAAIPPVPQPQSAIVSSWAPATLRPYWLGGVGFSNVAEIVGTNSAHGRVTATNNVFTYTPATNNYEGSASFTWRVRYNGTGTSVTVAFTLTLKGGSTNDWPQWRYDEHRSAQAPIFLPQNLSLQWRRDLPTAPGSYSMYPDLESCRPVQLGKTIFVPIGASDSMAAYDTDTGTNLWTFYASGAIRRPPLAVALTNGTNLVIVGSEDGYVYALHAASGAPVWKFQAAPNTKKAMGFGRLGSIWPVCMSPVESQGRIYFGAGFMPSWMLYVYCVDAASGQVIWRSDGGLLEQGQNSGIGPLTVSTDHAKIYGASGKQNAWMLDAGTGAFLGHGRYGTCSFYVDGAGNAPFSNYRDSGAYFSRSPSEAMVISPGDRTFTPSSVAALGVVGTVSSLLAGDGKLFVTTAQGSLYCFGGVAPATTNIFLHAPDALPVTNDVWTTAAAAMLSRDDLKQGLALVWGVGSGRLVEELAKQAPGLMVVACDPDPAKLRAIRVKMDAAGLSGARVSTVEGNPLDSGFAPYQAAILASEDLTAAGFANGGSFVTAAYTCTRPFGGEIWLPTSNAQHAAIAGWLEAAGLPTCGGAASYTVARPTVEGWPADGFTRICRTGLPDAKLAMKPPFRPIAFGEEYANNGLSMNIDFAAPIDHGRKAAGSTEPWTSFPPGSWDIYTWLPLTTATPGYEPPAATNVIAESLTMPSTVTNVLYGVVEPSPGILLYGDCGHHTAWGSLAMIPGKRASVYEASQAYWGVWHLGDRGGCSWGATKIRAMVGNGMMGLTGGHSGCGCGTAAGMQATQVAMVPEDEGEAWMAYSYSRSRSALQDQPVKRVGINLGGVGDRLVPGEQVLWTHYPYAGRDVAVETPPLIPVVCRGAARSVYHHSAQVSGTPARDRSWVSASQLVGMTGLTIQVASPLVADATTAAPVMDGTLGADTCWGSGHATELAVMAGRGKYVQPGCSNRAYVMLRYDDNNLYVAGVLSAAMKTYDQYFPARYLAVGCASRTNQNVKALFACTSSGNGNYPGTLGSWTCAYTESTNGFVGEMAIPWSTLAAAGIASNQLVLNVGVCGSTLNGPTTWEGGCGWNGSPDWSYNLYYKLAPAFYFSTLYFDAPTGAVATATAHTVRLYFAEMEDKTNGQRVFDVSLQGGKVLTNLDVVAEAGGGRRELVKTFYNVPVADKLEIALSPFAGEPMLSGVEILEASNNLAPQILAGPSAVPNPAATGAVVRFAVTATDANSDVLACGWTFGDGSTATGTNVTHSYGGSGVYTASVAVSDGSLAATGAVVITILSPFDSWRLSTFGSLSATNSGPTDDFDYDGMNNRAEWLAGTDPLSAASRLELKELRVSNITVGAGIVLRWSSVTDRFYAIEASTNLLLGFPATIRSNLPATPAVNTVTIQVDQAGQQFYRVRVE
jgi:hypothetical protein